MSPEGEAAEREAWDRRLRAAAESPPTPLRAVEFREALPTKSRPSVVLCDDGHEYVVKGRNAGRSTFNDQVVGHLGTAMGAPVAEVALVDVPLDLILDNFDMKDITDGIGHGSRWIPGTSKAERLLYQGWPENRPRFALLAVLYGWAQVEEDHQFIYETEPPHLVHSVDHGDFFPRGPGWSVASLRRAGLAVPDPVITFGAALGPLELAAAAVNLLRISDGTIAAAIVAPPDLWGVTFEERVAMAMYLAVRRDTFLTSLTRQPAQE